jgi:hypothetical protein
VLFVGGPSQATALVIKAAREQGFNGGFVVMDQAKFEEMNKLVPMAMLENAVGVMPMIHHPDFRAARFVEKYRQKKGADRDPPREVSLTYGALRVLAGMELATTTDAKAIHAKADEGCYLPDEFTSELLGVSPQDISGRPRCGPRGRRQFLPIKLRTSTDLTLNPPNPQPQSPNPNPKTQCRPDSLRVSNRIAVLTVDNPRQCPQRRHRAASRADARRRCRCNRPDRRGLDVHRGRRHQDFRYVETREIAGAIEGTHARLMRIEDATRRRGRDPRHALGGGLNRDVCHYRGGRRGWPAGSVGIIPGAGGTTTAPPCGAGWRSRCAPLASRGAQKALAAGTLTNTARTCSTMRSRCPSAARSARRASVREDRIAMAVWLPAAARSALAGGAGVKAPFKAVDAIEARYARLRTRLGARA